MIHKLETKRSIVTRSRSLKIAAAKEELMRAIAPIRGVIFSEGDASIVIKVNRKTSKNGRTEKMSFMILNDCFKVNYYFKLYYGNNNVISNAIESYLRSKGATYVL